MKNIRRKKTRKNRKQTGGELPIASVYIVDLLPISSLEETYKRPKNLNQKGGLISYEYVGSTWGNLVVSNFPISEVNLLSFRRLFANQSYMDCVISALQIIGILDFFTANIMRITSLSKIGFQHIEIELILSLRLNKRCLFKPTNNMSEFIQYVKQHLKPGNVVFCGASYTNIYHVFLIGMDLAGRIIKIDPQAPNPFCYLDTDQECVRVFAANSTTYYLLFNYEGNLTPEEQKELGFIF